MKKSNSKIIISSLIACGLIVSNAASAGVDISGTVPRIWVNPNGNLYFTVNNPAVNTYCAPGWYGFNMYIPKTDPNFPYYFGVLASAVANGKPVYIANISVFNGSTMCDITQTGYGVVFQQP